MEVATRALSAVCTQDTDRTGQDRGGGANLWVPMRRGVVFRRLAALSEAILARLRSMQWGAGGRGGVVNERWGGGGGGAGYSTPRDTSLAPRTLPPAAAG